MKKELIKLANHLDSIGEMELATRLDNIINSADAGGASQQSEQAAAAGEMQKIAEYLDKYIVPNFYKVKDKSNPWKTISESVGLVWPQYSCPPTFEFWDCCRNSCAHPLWNAQS